MFAKIRNYRYLSLVPHRLPAVSIFCLWLMLTALAVPGDLDLTFDTDGKVITPFAAGSIGEAVAIQTDGKIVVGGTSNGKFALARYNPDGERVFNQPDDGSVDRTAI